MGVLEQKGEGLSIERLWKKGGKGIKKGTYGQSKGRKEERRKNWILRMYGMGKFEKGQRRLRKEGRGVLEHREERSRKERIWKKGRKGIEKGKCGH
jgi:hypothetical protein